MSRALQDKVQELFEATKNLQSFEEIRPYCEAFNNWISNNTNYSINSLGTVLSRAGLYKKFKSITLEQGKNADLVPKHDGEGNVVGHELKHYVLLLCGLDQLSWDERNKTTRVSSRLESNGQEINPDEYLLLVGKLLSSDSPNEVAVGLIAATGRRPHEIVARAKFAPIKGEAYQVLFTGQGKKRGENPVFPIATLYEATYVIDKLNWFRQQPSTKKLLMEVAQEHPKDIEAQNRAIDSRRNGSLNRVVRAFFGDEGDENPIVPFRHGEDNSNCKALRAVYLALATERDCHGSIGSKMLHAARLAGHFVKENPDDRDLQHLVTTLGYADYYTTKPVPLPGTPEKEKVFNVKVNTTDIEIIRQFQEKWGCPNQQLTISKLIKYYNMGVDVVQKAQQKIADLEIQLQQLQTANSQEKEINQQLQTASNQQHELTTMETKQQPQQVTLNVHELEQWLESKIVEVVNRVVEERAIAPAPTSASAAKVPTKQEIDWTAKTDADVWGSKATGAAVEKIRRSYQAICQYNDTVATGDGDRLAVTNLALRELSGCNGLLIRDWIEEHKDEVISHNAKYGMENKKDLLNPATYANKGKDITKILSVINEQFLSGEALRVRQ